METSIEKPVKKIVEELGREGISFDGKKIAISGGAGFLGSWLCDVLVMGGAKVICIDNFSSGNEKNIEHLKNNANFRLLRCDVSKIFSLKNIDMFFHFASRASPLEFAEYAIEIWKANTLGTINALEVARKNRARFIFASTSEVYGNPPDSEIPTKESYYGNVSCFGPRSCYDESKRSGEAITMAYFRKHRLDVRIVRIFNTYGQRMAYRSYGRAIPRFIFQALKNEQITIFGNGMQTRSFTYVADEIKGILKLAFHDSLAGEIFNIGSNREISILELAKLIKKITKSSSEITFLEPMEDDPRRRCPDITKAKTILKWKPEISLEEGIKIFAEYIKKEIGKGD